MKISVITNSDYVMNELLAKDRPWKCQRRLSKQGKGIPGISGIFLVRRGTTDSVWLRQHGRERQLDGWAEHYLEFVRSRLQE